MNKKLLFLCLFVIVLASCQTASPPTTEAAEPTNTVVVVPSDTNTPEPTPTPEPSPTPSVELPDELNRTFLGVSVTHRDNFDYVIDNQLPTGWEVTEKYSAWVTKDNQFQVKPLGDGNPWSRTFFAYLGHKLLPNSGVFFTFKYTLGNSEEFTLGIDNENPNGILGERWDNFYSVAMNIPNGAPGVHAIQRNNQIEGRFNGNLLLQQNTWYNIAIAFDQNQKFIIKVWDPNNPQNQITYLREWVDFPSEYYFISYTSAEWSWVMDDFTVFKFDEIIQ